MAGFSDYLEDKVLNHVFAGSAFTAPSTLHVALYTVAPSDTGGGTEVSGGAYARQTAGYGTVVAVGILDASSGGNLLAYANLDSSKVVSTGDVFRFNTGDLDITLA